MSARAPSLFPLLSVLGVAAIAGCAGSLRDELDRHPNGRFAEAALARAPRSVTPPATPLDVVPDEPVATAPVEPEPKTARRGPVTAAELAIGGIDADDRALAALRGGDWRPDSGRAFEHGDARRAFFSRSPAIAEAVQRYRAAFERYDQVAALDDLVRQYDAFAKDLKTGATTPSVKPNLAKRFPFGGVADLQGELVAVDVALARVMLERELAVALADFERAFQEAYYWQRATAVLGQVKDLSDRVVEAARARYGAGSTSHANLIQAEIRRESLAVRLTTARAQRGAAKKALAAALDLPAGALERTTLALDTALPRRPPRDAVTAATLAHGPEVVAARLAEARATLLVQLSERQLQPNLTEGHALSPRPADADLMYATGGPFLREMAVRADAAAAARADAERQAPARADQAWVALDDALRRHRSSAGSQLARAQQGADVAELGYRAGTATFFDLDSAVQLYLSTALDARAALRDAHVAAARLAILVGAGGADAPPSPPPQGTRPERQDD